MSRFLHILTALVLVVSLAGCSNANKSLSGKPTKPGSPQDFAVNVGTTVHFTTDSTQLTEQALSILRGQVAWLNKYPNYTVTLEGHADERGTREYNMALGERRANAVTEVLTLMGVGSQQTEVISYGEEKPVALGHDEYSYQLNRRVELIY